MSRAESTSTRLSLLSRVRANDTKAWQDLVDLYSPLVAFWCRKRAVAESDINDLIQDVFFIVCRNLESYTIQHEAGGFRGWLWTITRNKLVDAHRRQHLVVRGSGGSTALGMVQQIPATIEEDDPSEQHEFTKLIYRGLSQVEAEFEPKSWQAFWRTTVDGQSIANVATELGISAATVRQHRSRILRRLREQLGEVE